jgi:hypothetical protein
MKSVHYLLILLFTGFTLAGNAQTPLLNSYPSAKATIYIDFDGQYVAGTVWNWSGNIDAQPAGLTVAAMTEIFNRVAEDYRPFDLTVTTDSTIYWSAPTDQRIRIIVTPSSSWYGSAGGVAYVGSFTWGDNTPGWVFSALLGNNTKNVAEAISHEAGHTLGLQHQSTYNSSCVKTAEYSSGQGTGEIGWAPIMGVGYSKNLTTWHNGPSTIGCTVMQSDFDIITTYNGFGLRPDDHGDDISTATDVPVSAGLISVNGVINSATDLDAFKIVLPETSGFSLKAIPQNVGSGDAGANIDIKIFLLNNTDTIASYNPSTLLNAGIDSNLNAGTYYLIIDGVGNVNHSDYGSLGYYSLAGNVATILPVRNLFLQGSNSNGQSQFSWNFQTDETVTKILLESSIDGKQFKTLTGLNPGNSNYNYQQPPAFTGAFYRLKVITSTHLQGYYSNTIVLRNKPGSANVQQVFTGNSGELTLNSSSNYDYQLYSSNGQLISHGRLQQGVNSVPAQSAKGILLLHYNDASQSFVQKIIKQ